MTKKQRTRNQLIKDGKKVSAYINMASRHANFFEYEHNLNDYSKEDLAESLQMTERALKKALRFASGQA